MIAFDADFDAIVAFYNSIFYFYFNMNNIAFYNLTNV